MPEALESTPTTRTSQGILQTHTRTTLAKKTPRKKPIKIIKSKAVFSYESVIFAIEVVIWNNGNNCNSNKSATTVQQHGLSQCTKQPPTNSNGKLHNANSILFPSLCPPPRLSPPPFLFLSICCCLTLCSRQRHVRFPYTQYANISIEFV